MKIALLSLALVLFSSYSRALPEAEVSESFSTEVLSWYQSHMRAGEFRSVKNLVIRYFSFEQAEAQCVLVFSPGQGEPSLKYAELFFDLKDLGCNLFSIDHRSQGYSHRLLSDSQKTHIEHYSDYITDFTFLVNSIIQPKKYQHSLLLAHSMGGAIASGYLRKFPKTFSKVILSAPMMEINGGQYNQIEALLFADLLMLLWRGEDYAPGQSGYDPNTTFEQGLTNSEARFRVTTDLQNAIPQIQSGGVTVRWVAESLYFTLGLRQTKFLFQVPTVIFQAGLDTKVLPDGQNQVCGLSPQMCRIEKFPQAKHGFLIEKDSIRDRVLEQIKSALH